MRKIPEKIKLQLMKDKFMWNCCLCGISKAERKIDWHHNLIYAGKQSNDPHSILPLCRKCHAKADDTRVKEVLDWIMFFVRGLNPLDYPKSLLFQRFRYLSTLYISKKLEYNI